MDAVHKHSHQLVQYRFSVHKNISSFRSWCMLPRDRGKGNYKMEKNNVEQKILL